MKERALIYIFLTLVSFMLTGSQAAQEKMAVLEGPVPAEGLGGQAAAEVQGETVATGLSGTQPMVQAGAEAVLAGIRLTVLQVRQALGDCTAEAVVAARVMMVPAPMARFPTAGRALL